MIKIVNQVDVFPGAVSGSITIPATTAGNVLIILAVTRKQGMQWTAPNHISTSDGDFTEVPFYSLQSGSLWDWGSFAASVSSADILYQVTSGGVTTINFDANLAIDAIFVREVSGLVTPVVVDDYKLTGSGTSVPVVGSDLAGAGANDLCYENFCTAAQTLAGAALTSPWLVDLGLQDEGTGPLFQKGVSGTQLAAVPFNSSGAQPSDKYTCVSVAFKGVGSAPTTLVDESGNPITLKYVFGDNRNNLVRFVDTNGDIHTAGPLYSNDYTGNFNNFLLHSVPGAVFSSTWGTTMLGDHLVYVADQGTGILWQIDLITGICLRIAGGGASGGPNAVATDWSLGAGSLFTVKAGLDGNLYIGVPSYQTIICINMKTAPITVCGVVIPVGNAAFVAGTSSGQGFASDYSVAVDANGNVYAGVEGNNTGSGNEVWKTDTAGVATKIAGTGTDTNTGDGGPASAATMDAPLGLAIDKNNVLYVICSGKNGLNPGAIRSINLSGANKTVCGQTIAPGNIATLISGGTGTSDLWACEPDNQGNLYVCDLGVTGSTKGWLHLLDSSAVYSVVAGSSVGTTGYSGDGGPATSALIGETYGVGIPVFPAPPAPAAPPGGDHYTPSIATPAGTVQNVPLDNSPNQIWNISVNVDGKSIPLTVALRYNEIAQYWVMTIYDGNGNLLLDSIPFVTGEGVAQNLLAQFVYMKIGSATLFNVSGASA